MNCIYIQGGPIFERVIQKIKGGRFVDTVLCYEWLEEWANIRRPTIGIQGTYEKKYIVVKHELILSTVLIHGPK